MQIKKSDIHGNVVSVINFFHRFSLKLKIDQVLWRVKYRKSYLLICSNFKHLVHLLGLLIKDYTEDTIA